MFNDTKLYLISDIETRLSCLLVRIHPIIIRCILRKQSSAPYFLLTLGFQTPSEIQPTHQTSFTRFDPSLPPIQQFRLNNFWNEILSWNESLPFHELCHHLIWTEKKTNVGHFPCVPWSFQNDLNFHMFKLSFCLKSPSFSLWFCQKLRFLEPSSIECSLAVTGFSRNHYKWWMDLG